MAIVRAWTLPFCCRIHMSVICRRISTSCWTYKPTNNFMKNQQFLLFYTKQTWMQNRLKFVASLKPIERDPAKISHFDCSSTTLDVTWQDETKSRFHPRWLWYNCACGKCRQEGSGQRILEPQHIPHSLSVREAECIEQQGVHLVHVHYNEVDHVSIHPVHWLKRNSYSEEDLAIKSQLRDVQYLKGSLSEFDYNDISHSGDHRFQWMQNLDIFGVNIVKNIPTEDDSLTKVLNMLGGVMPTLYGNSFDVVSTPNPINIAYSSVHLDYHQDLEYYESPPGLQLLHCVRFDPEVTGGESYFIDAFHVAETLRDQHPKHFQTLLDVPATFQKLHFERENPAAFIYQRPHITINKQGKITGIWWSPQFEGPLQVPEEDVDRYFDAYHKFAELIASSPTETSYRLHPGDCAVFNNRRMLHARKEFQLNGGQRHLKGGYVNIDEFRNKMQVEYMKRNTGKLTKRMGNQCLF